MTKVKISNDTLIIELDTGQIPYDLNSLLTLAKHELTQLEERFLILKAKSLAVEAATHGEESDTPNLPGSSKGISTEVIHPANSEVFARLYQ